MKKMKLKLRIKLLLCTFPFIASMFATTIAEKFDFVRGSTGG